MTRNVLTLIAVAFISLVSCIVGAVGTFLVIPAPDPKLQTEATAQAIALLQIQEQATRVAELHAQGATSAASAPTREPTNTPAPLPTRTCKEIAATYLTQTNERLLFFIDEINRRGAKGTGLAAFKDFDTTGWQGAKRELDAHAPPACLAESHRLIIEGMDSIILGIVAYVNNKPDNNQLRDGEQKFMQGYAARLALTGAPTPRPNLLNLPKR